MIREGFWWSLGRCCMRFVKKRIAVGLGLALFLLAIILSHAELFWEQVSTTGPGARSSHAMAYDSRP